MLRITVYAFLFLLFGCQNNDYNPAYFADKYCACIEENSKTKDFFESRVICEGLIVKQNRFFRTHYIEANYGRYMIFLEKKYCDSVAEFNLNFYREIEKKCCELAVPDCNKSDSLQMRRKSLDDNFEK